MRLKTTTVLLGIIAIFAFNTAQSNALENTQEKPELIKTASFYQPFYAAQYSPRSLLSFNQNHKLSLAESASFDNQFPTLNLGENSYLNGFSRINIKEQQVGLGLHFNGDHVSFIAGKGEGFSRLSNQYNDIDPYYFHGGSSADFEFNSVEWMHQFGGQTSLTMGKAVVTADHLENRTSQYIGGQLGSFNAHIMQINRGNSKAGRALSLGFDLPMGHIKWSGLKHVAGGEISQLSYAYQSGLGNRYSVSLSDHSNPLIEEDHQFRIMVGVRRQLGGGRLWGVDEDSEEAKPRANKFVVLGGIAVGATLALSSGSDNQDNNIRFEEQHAAAKQVLNSINPTSVREDREYGGWIYRTPDDRYLATKPIRGQAKQLNIPTSLLPPGTQPLASYHTHGALNPNFITEQFSPADISSDQNANVDGYLGTPRGSFLWHSVRQSRVRLLGQIAN